MKKYVAVSFDCMDIQTINEFEVDSLTEFINQMIEKERSDDAEMEPHAFISDGEISAGVVLSEDDCEMYFSVDAYPEFCERLMADADTLDEFKDVEDLENLRYEYSVPAPFPAD